MSPVGDGGGEQDHCHICSGGRSVTHVPSLGWGRRGGSLPCTQWGMLSDTCPQWGIGEEERIISAMYTMGDTHSHMFPVGDDGGEEEPWHVCSGGTLSDTCPQWEMGEERRITAMYAVGDAQ